MSKSVGWPPLVSRSVVHDLETWLLRLLLCHFCLHDPSKFSSILAAVLHKSAYNTQCICRGCCLCPYLMTPLDYVMLPRHVYCDMELMQCSKTREREKARSCELCRSLSAPAGWQLARCGRREWKHSKAQVWIGVVRTMKLHTHTLSKTLFNYVGIKWTARAGSDCVCACVRMREHLCAMNLCFACVVCVSCY